jgi:Holliday junction DNA helicase RuvA
MIVRMRGRLAELSDEVVIVEREGLAYEILVPSYALAELAASRGGDITLHTLEYLEGNAAGGNLTPRLVGFLHAEDRAFFKQFLTVKGVGVRKALRAFAAPVARIASDIEAADAVALARLPGIGRRMAEQIIAELRGKVTAHAFAVFGAPPASASAFTREQLDAIEILVAWGDGRAEAERWVARAAQLHKDVSSAEAWVKAAYRVKGGAE